MLKSRKNKFYEFFYLLTKKQLFVVRLLNFMALVRKLNSVPRGTRSPSTTHFIYVLKP